MVKDALSMAGQYKQMESDLMLSLCPGGAPVNAEAVADSRERLERWRGLVVSFLLEASREATQAERRELSAALILISTPVKAF